MDRTREQLFRSIVWMLGMCYGAKHESISQANVRKSLQHVGRGKRGIPNSNDQIPVHIISSRDWTLLLFSCVLIC
jgi:hypothetical protein